MVRAASCAVLVAVVPGVGSGFCVCERRKPLDFSGCTAGFDVGGTSDTERKKRTQGRLISTSRSTGIHLNFGTYRATVTFTVNRLKQRRQDCLHASVIAPSAASSESEPSACASMRSASSKRPTSISVVRKVARRLKMATSCTKPSQASANLLLTILRR